jgi:hypothetical protein
MPPPWEQRWISLAGFCPQRVNQWKISEKQKEPQFPEADFDSPDFGFQGFIASAKRGDTDLRANIGRKEARPDTALQKGAVGGEERFFKAEAFADPAFE